MSPKTSKGDKNPEKQTKAGNAAKREVPELRDILLALIWQLAESDRSFQKYVIEQFRKSPRAFVKASQLWYNLIEAFCLQPQASDSRPHCFFLIIDADDASNNRNTKSLSQTMQEYAESLSKKLDKKPSCCHVRVMIARAEDAPSKSPKDLKAREIKLPQDSRDSDVQIFIEHHLKDLFSAWSKGSEGYRLVRSLERRLISLFSTGDTVNYHVLAGLLEEISRIGKNLYQLRKFEKECDPDNIKQVFNSVIVPSQLKRLDEQLGDEDKRILNDVISYLICVLEWPTTDQLGAFLSLSQGNSFTKNIEDEIRKKYSHIMTIKSGKYVTSDTLLLFFREHNRKQPWYARKQPWYARKEESEGDKTAETHKVELAELMASTPDIVTLTTFITGMLKRNTARPKLQFNYEQSHIMIIKVFLSTICSEDHRERAAVTELQAYTGMNLLWHLWNLKRDKKLKDVITDLESKQSIGKHLYHFFMEERSVRTWLSQSDPSYLREQTCAYLEDARGWLEDEDVWRGFEEGRSIPSSDQGNSTTQKHMPTHPVDARVFTGVSEEPLATSPEFANYNHDGEIRTSLQLPKEDTAESVSEAEGNQIPLEVAEPTEKTISEPKTSDQPRPDVVNQPLLALVVKISAYQWLEDLTWDASEAFLWLLTVTHEVLKMPIEIGAVVGLAEYRKFHEKAYTNMAGDTSDFTKEDIEEAEKWAVELLKIQDVRPGLSSTKDLRIAQTLFGLKVQPKHELAEERCAFAQDFESSSFEATLFLSKIFEENGNQKRALNELSKIRPYLQSLDFRGKDPTRWQDELDRFWRLCNETNSVKHALIACRDLWDQPESDSAGYIAQAQEWMLRAKDWREIFGELTAIREKDGRSLLTAVLHSTASSDTLFHQHLHLALKRDFGKLLRSYADAIYESTDKEITPHLRYWYGVSLMYTDKPRDAHHEWEDLCRDIKSRAKVSTEMALLFAQTAEKLVSSYISIAQSHEHNATFHAAQVRELEKWNEWISGNLQYSFNYLTLLLGRLYQVTGHPRKAQKMVRGHLSTAFELLEDDRIENDRKGYFRIAEALMSLDDEAGALTAWTLVACRRLYKDEYESEEIDEFLIACAGDCGWSWDGSSDLDRDLYICHDCAHIRFEESCYKKLLQGSLEQRVCRKGHRLMKVPKLKRRDRERIVGGYVMANGKAEKIETWLATTRRKYGISKTDQPWTERPMEFSQVAKWKIKRSLDKESRMIRKREFGQQITQ